MGFVRFVLSTAHPDTGVEEGLFRRAYELRDDGGLPEGEQQALAELMRWFEENLPVPDRFNRSRSKGYYRRTTRGIAWLRDTARAHCSQMFRLKEILEAHGHRVSVIHEARVGYVVYQDDHQVVAEPFADTQTGPSG
jgi:hypothetical protein